MENVYRVEGEDRALALWEIVSVVASVLVAEWVVFALAGDSAWALLVPVTTVIAFMLLSHRARGETAREVGWRLDNFWKAARLLAAPMAVCGALLVAVGWYTSNLDFVRWEGGQSLFGVPVLSLLWGPLQQYALQGFINRRAQVVWGRGWRSVLLVASAFALMHLPNPWLTFATFAGGLLWAYVYQRAPNLLALGLSHALMTWVLISSVPPSALHNLRVGFKYFG
ncbi:MAG TPA: CPBP family intramembrane glutamic endopeptidase [Pyrinomonadaceae bacterium]|jgi:membrane protease YdiL (CAAX protease family)|nr:CPBP family intramembrane glutamic endopeptidase [Pyrinomonadaceae bacterium]